MKRALFAFIAAAMLSTAASADLVSLVSGKKYQGAVIEWGEKQISFVLQGGALSDAFIIPTDLIATVTLQDSSDHTPGTASWISAGRLERLPWDQLVPTPGGQSGPNPAAGKPLDLLSLKSYSLRLSPVGKRETGYTSYQIVFPWDPYFGNSRLDFPLDGFSAGLSASALSRPFGSGGWQLGMDLEIAKNLTDPKHDMADSDWVSVSATGSASQDDYRLVFSATTSAAKSSNWDITASARLMFPVAPMLKAGGLLGYRYLHLYYDIYGVTGWQDTTWNGDIVYFDELHNTRVLQYTVSYKLPMAGLVLLSESDEGLTLQARCARLFSAAANDEDLHLLRNKKSACSASGGGWLLDGEASVRIATLRNRETIELGGSYQYLTVNTAGSQVQTYYGDDPGYDGDQTGLSASGIRDKLFIKRQSFGVFLNYIF